MVSVTNLPVPDGERVQVVVTDLPVPAKLTIVQARQLLAGGVERYDDPFDPSIPGDSWEMLK
jgi:hypothetical protein